MSLSVLLVEDEFIIAEDIRIAAESHGHTVSGIAYSYDEALELLEKHKPDIALLDITLGEEQQGLKLGRLLYEELDIPFVYVTSHSDAATIAKVKETNPSGFLLKPFNREAIYTAIEMALANYTSRKESEGQERAFFYRQGTKKLRIPYRDIYYLEADGNYTKIHTAESVYTERKTIGEMLEELQEGPFIRVHKSFSVNKNKVQQISREMLGLGTYRVPVGRTYRNEVARLFQS